MDVELARLRGTPVSPVGLVDRDTCGVRLGGPGVRSSVTGCRALVFLNEDAFAGIVSLSSSLSEVSVST